MDKKIQNEEKYKDELVFRGQRKDEYVIFTAKQHSWVLAKRGLVILICCLVMVGAVAFFGASPISSWIIFILVVFVICYGFYYWFLWWNGEIVLTNQRIIQTVQNGFFSKKILETELEKIQDAVCEIKGLSNSMLNIGSVQFQTASKEKIIKMDYLLNPYDVQQKIVNAQKRTNRSEKRMIV